MQSVDIINYDDCDSIFEIMIVYSGSLKGGEFGRR